MALHRDEWDLRGIEIEPRAEHDLRIWTAIFMWLGGGSSIVAVILLPGASKQHLAELRGLVGFSIFAAIFTFVAFRPASDRVLYVLNNVFSALGAVGIALACYWSGGAHSGLFELLFFTVFYDAYFFRAREVVLHLSLNSMLALSPLLYQASVAGTQFPGHVAVLLVGFWGISAVIWYRKHRLLLAEMRSRVQALSDPLTGLCNVRGLSARAETAKLTHGCGVLVVDIDRFKTVNSHHGHTGADRLLRQVGRELMRVSDARDCVARIGGDEFVILVSGRTASEIEPMTGACAEAVRGARAATGLDGPDLSASVGCAIWPQDGESFAELLSAADHRMFSAKRVAAYAVEPMLRPAAASAVSLSLDFGAEDSAAHGPTVAAAEALGSEAASRLRPTGIPKRWEGWWKARPAQSLVAAAAWLGASVTILLVLLMPQADSVHFGSVLALAGFGLVSAAFMLLAAPAVGSAAYVVCDALGVASLALAVGLTGATTSPLLPLVFLGVAFAAYFSTLRGALVRLAGAILVCASPLVYVTPGDRVSYIVRFVALVSTASVLAGIILHNKRELTEAERAARELALQDPLTGIPNRRAFYRDLARAIADAQHGSGPLLGVAMIDLDNFKRINDRHGHAAGDTLLQAIARALAGVVRGGDYIARVGGDEFALIAPEATISAGHTLGARCVAAVERASDTAGFADCDVSATVGYALFPDHATTLGELVAAADAALMRAKDAGKHQVKCADTRSPGSPTPARAEQPQDQPSSRLPGALALS
jgi:diguanylate cyclase (GGDEF)-like protein